MQCWMCSWPEPPIKQECHACNSQERPAFCQAAYLILHQLLCGVPMHTFERRPLGLLLCLPCFRLCQQAGWVGSCYRSHAGCQLLQALLTLSRLLSTSMAQGLQAQMKGNVPKLLAG